MRYNMTKHLQIGDVFYAIDGVKVYCEKVRAIALEPDDTIIKSEYQLIKSTETKIGLHKVLKGGEK